MAPHRARCAFQFLKLCKEMRGKADFGGLWNARKLSRESLQQKAGFEPEIDSTLCPICEDISEPSCYCTTLVVARTGGLHRGHWKMRVWRHLFQSDTLASSLMDVQVVIALQKGEIFIRASRADIKKILGINAINWGRVCPAMGGSLQPSQKYSWALATFHYNKLLCFEVFWP